RHVFRRVGIPAKLRLRLAINDRPRANLPYRMTLDAAEGELTGVTDAEGVLELFIPASARVATLWIDDDPTPVRLAVGHMDPAEEWSGVGKRLANLGYLASPSAIPGAGEGPPPRLVRAL